MSTDASASTAADGATLAYEWSWGDGSATDSGVDATHTYDAPGTYAVQLKVTDSLGIQRHRDQAGRGRPGRAACLRPLRPQPGHRLGQCRRRRCVVGTTGFSTAGGSGLVSVPASVTRVTALPTSVGDATTTFTVGVDKPIAGGTAQVNYLLHRSSAGEYRVKLRYLNTGQVTVWLTKNVGGAETLLADGGTLAGVTQAGSTLRVKVQSTTVGGTTTLRTKVWPTGTAEPAAWRVSASDSQAALQAAGQIGFNVYANGSVSNGPLVFGFDDLNVG